MNCAGASIFRHAEEICRRNFLLTRARSSLVNVIPELSIPSKDSNRAREVVLINNHDLKPLRRQFEARYEYEFVLGLSGRKAHDLASSHQGAGVAAESQGMYD